MINEYNLNDKNIILQSDIAGEYPIYIYLNNDKKILLYSKNIVQLLDDKRVKKPLEVSIKAVSFILQSGVIPPPLSIYENIFILGIGYKANISTIEEEIQVDFKYEFPFFNKNRLKKEDMIPNKNRILELVANSTIERIDKSKSTFLFHSAGKDSNTIALALAKAGWQNQVTLITHKSKGNKDESEISKSIANKLGFKHEILFEVDHLKNEHIIAIDNYFVNSPFPCADNVTLVYPLYKVQMPELSNSNIIDGGGNDVYMMTPYNSRDLKVLPMSKYTSSMSKLRNIIPSENIISLLVKTPAEWFDMSGLNFSDTYRILPNSFNTNCYWEQQSKKLKLWDLIDFKTHILTTIIATEVHIRKVRNFTDVINSNLIIPFANFNLANYFSKMPEDYLFDRKNLKNKIILREILKEEIALDSDKLGKMGFSYDYISLVIQNYKLLTDEIFNCNLWNKDEIEKVVNRMQKSLSGKGWSSRAAARFIYRLYLVSAWLNKNKWVNS